MDDVKQDKTKRDTFMERMKSKHPDMDFADDDALYDRIGADYDEYDAAITSSREREQKLIDTFNTNPHGAQFLTDMVKGNDPWCGLIERIGIDGVTDIISDPEKQKEFAEANSKFLQRVAKEKELEEQYESNMDASLETMERLKRERGLTDDDIDKAADLLKQIVNELIVGIFSEEALDMAFKALNYESAVAGASREGEIRGRNTKVRETIRKPQPTDGLPALGGAPNTPQSNEEEDNIFSIARGARR